MSDIYDGLAWDWLMRKDGPTTRIDTAWVQQEAVKLAAHFRPPAPEPASVAAQVDEAARDKAIDLLMIELEEDVDREGEVDRPHWRKLLTIFARSQQSGNQLAPSGKLETKLRDALTAKISEVRSRLVGMPCECSECKTIRLLTSEFESLLSVSGIRSHEEQAGTGKVAQ